MHWTSGLIACSNHIRFDSKAPFLLSIASFSLENDTSGRPITPTATGLLD